MSFPFVSSEAINLSADLVMEIHQVLEKHSLKTQYWTVNYLRN